MSPVDKKLRFTLDEECSSRWFERSERFVVFYTHGKYTYLYTPDTMQTLLTMDKERQLELVKDAITEESTIKPDRDLIADCLRFSVKSAIEQYTHSSTWRGIPTKEHPIVLNGSIYKVPSGWKLATNSSPPHSGY